ncbi:hypothetical protein [Desulfocurvus vexinensis]|uniref:hypothetical protein n=1 Tax=Desulfocurvus vexinensis TaxID=399548 RepID=UPI0004B8B99A|nr:hypothetical protein [Desulfocurvus vexinensis]
MAGNGQDMPLGYRLLEAGAHVFDALHCFWERERTVRRVATLLVLAFMGSLAVIELNRLGLIGGHLSRILPTNLFYAVNFAFTLVLVVEVVSMIFVLPRSFSRSVGKQFEILALILMRNSFKELVNLHTVIHYPDDLETLLRILSDGVGALVVFFLLGVYARLPRGQEAVRDGAGLYAFVLTKKVLALALLAVFCGLGLYNGWRFAAGGELVDFFQVFYTVLIFSDIFVVLLSQRYLPSFHAVFRNSGLALTTLIIRLALSSPPFLNTALGITAAGFAVVLTYVCNLAFARGDGACPGEDGRAG